MRKRLLESDNLGVIFLVMEMRKTQQQKKLVPDKYPNRITIEYKSDALPLRYSVRYLFSDN